MLLNALAEIAEALLKGITGVLKVVMIPQVLIVLMGAWAWWYVVNHHGLVQLGVDMTFSEIIWPLVPLAVVALGLMVMFRGHKKGGGKGGHH